MVTTTSTPCVTQVQCTMIESRLAVQPCWLVLPAAGLSKKEVLSEGVHVLAAFDQLADFVRTNTPPGQTPVVVGHQGFELLFKQVEQCLQRAAVAAAAAGQSGTTSSSTSITESSCSSSGGGDTIVANSSTSTSSRGKGRRRRSILEHVVKVDPIASDDSSSTINSTGHQHLSWPQEWMFLDTYVMAHVMLSLLPEQQGAIGQALRKKLLPGLYTLQQAEGVSSQRLKPRGDSLSACAELPER